MHANYICSRGAELHYTVLRHLDLGDDRASIYDPDLPQTNWSSKLLDAYRASPDAMLLQVLPLVAHLERSTTESGLLNVLRERSRDARLVELVETAYADLGPAVRDEWTAKSGLNEEAIDAIDEPLGRLRRKLWSRIAKKPPPLCVLDVPALESRDGWTHGRAVSLEETRLVAVSLDVPNEHALIQLLHEEVHPLTDPVVRAEHEGTEDLTDELESTAIDVGAAVVEAAAPELTDVYDEWRARFD